MEIIPVVPRGYCKGVTQAIALARKTAREHPGIPITMLGMIVHNRYVVEALALDHIRCIDHPGKTRLQLLDEIEEGIVIFTAHGVSRQVMVSPLRRAVEETDRKIRAVSDGSCEPSG